MEGDNIQIFLGFIQILGDGPSDEGITDPMKTIFAQLILLGDRRVNRIGADIIRNGMMKSRVKVGDILSLGKIFDATTHDGQRRSVVSGTIPSLSG